MSNIMQASKASPRFFLASLAITLLPLAGPAIAAEPSAATDMYSIARGGVLYDKWWAVLEQDPPASTHPSYPAAGKKKGSATWRCKECHGWDYKGVNGAYAKGSHYSGIKGVSAMQGTDPGKIAAIIRDKTHGYTPAMIPKRAALRLGLFLSRGQIDMDKYIDRASKKVRGDAGRGASFYQTICAICHGFDGKALNFKTEENPEYVGTLAQKDPWEGLHKIRNGQPGVPMVALTALSVQDQLDILAYAQTLPAK